MRTNNGSMACNNRSRKTRQRSLSRSVSLAFVGVLVSAFPAWTRTPTPHLATNDTLQIVRAVMKTPDGRIDFARAKLTFDKIYDSSTDIAARLKEIDAMAQAIRAMAGPTAPSRLRLIMLRKYIYEAGAWNDNRPFQYDLSDPLGHKPKNRLLSTYLLARRGNCVSVPT